MKYSKTGHSILADDYPQYIKDPMTAPDGKQYNVAISDQADAIKHGWKK
jgi:hypothetical protein